MDPEENLKQQLEIAARFVELSDNDVEDPDFVQELVDECRHLGELIESLHEWLSKGGFKPRAWHQPIDPKPYLIELFNALKETCPVKSGTHGITLFEDKLLLTGKFDTFRSAFIDDGDLLKRPRALALEVAMVLGVRGT